MANPRIAKHINQAVSASVARRTSKAETFAANVPPLIERLQTGGASIRQIAVDLNEKNVKTVRDGRWHAGTVRNVLAR
jgi:hypothetical protein